MVMPPDAGQKPLLISRMMSPQMMCRLRRAKDISRLSISNAIPPQAWEPIRAKHPISTPWPFLPMRLAMKFRPWAQPLSGCPIPRQILEPSLAAILAVFLIRFALPAWMIGIVRMVRPLNMSVNGCAHGIIRKMAKPCNKRSIVKSRQREQQLDCLMPQRLAKLIFAGWMRPNF